MNSPVMNSAASLLRRLTMYERGLEIVRSKPVIRRRTLKRRMLAVLADSGSTVRQVELKPGPAEQPLWVVGVRVSKGRMALTLAPGIEQTRQFWYLFDRLPGVLHLAALAGRDLQFKVDVSDGHLGFQDVLAFCSNHDSVILIPDPDFFASRGYAELREQAAPAWAGRSSDIIWRASPNGQGRISNATMKPDDTDLVQRVRMCLMLRDQQGVDARLVMSDRTEELTPTDAQRLEQAGISGQAIDRVEWWQQRYAIDVDGYTNAWSGLFTRLLMGCCVLKIASPTGHRQWYYHRLEPWQHYVPLAADLSDLLQKIDWCRTHETDCQRIAGQGRDLALSMDFESEYRRAAELLARPVFPPE